MSNSYFFTIKVLLFTLFLCTCTTNGYTSQHGSSLKLSGNILQIVIPATAFGTTIGLKDFKGSREFTNGFIATTLTTYGLKYAINERRPSREKHSFPSGHAAIAFYGSGFIQQRYGWKYAVPAYAAAIFVGYSRIKIKEHWMHDVIGGAAVGLLYSILLTTPYHNPCYQLFPVLTADSIALQCEGQF